MQYTPYADLAFNSVEHIVGDVEGGWLVRYMHANGASMFLVVSIPSGICSVPRSCTAFMGYTRLASAKPVVGETIVPRLWSCFSVDNATLNRFVGLHHLPHFLLLGASLLHPAALHQHGSNNAMGVQSKMDKIASHPCFYVKDLVGQLLLSFFFFHFWFYATNVLGHSANYIPANSIVPEWNFLSINDKSREV
ncbi:LOW QUALITY PROTEIN: hypothetical protein RJ640_027475 [Escallonia rubra]|uniref:Cytochrome b n=1 Tax=Escallonia rubra TaxID=112253 RepID=A0AA88QR98_9ASTE|nr:LOW QUALITY PROTEIN: hypothetical protein RJ640_027475 [Escallonia rubra]